MDEMDTRWGDLPAQPKLMLMLQHIMDAQTDNVMGAVGRNTKGPEWLERTLEKAQGQVVSRIGSVEENITNVEERAEEQFAGFQARLQKLGTTSAWRTPPPPLFHRQAPAGVAHEALRPRHSDEARRYLQDQEPAGRGRDGECRRPAVPEEGGVEPALLGGHRKFPGARPKATQNQRRHCPLDCDTKRALYSAGKEAGSFVQFEKSMESWGGHMRTWHPWECVHVAPLERERRQDSVCCLAASNASQLSCSRRWECRGATIGLRCHCRSRSSNPMWRCVCSCRSRSSLALW